MNPIVFAMRRPVTTLMLVVGLISGGTLAYNRMRVDIFPPLNTPKIYVFLDYIGMSPDQMEGFIVNQLELYFQYVDGIQDINTRNIQQVALCELSFFPGTDMGQAMAQVVAMSDRAMSWMPKGTLPPMIMRMDAGSVPVGYLVFESEQTSLGAMGDLAQNVIRPLVQKYVPGTVAISPFGPNMRSIVIDVDPQKLLDYNLMTACAMSVGMVPMALALERGSQMQAPLGRAVIGGLVMSTFATLLVVPSIFAVVIGKRVARSPSIYPDDPESAYYDPRVFIDEPADAHHDASGEHVAAVEHAPHDDVVEPTPLESLANLHEDVLPFLRRILDEARSKRHDMTTHYTVDDLRVALGFAKTRLDEADPHGISQNPAGGRSSGHDPDWPPDASTSHGES